MTKPEFYSQVSLLLKRAGYYSDVVDNQLHVYGADDFVAVSFKRNVVTIDGSEANDGDETDWNYSFSDNMVVLTCCDVIDKLFPMTDCKKNDCDSEKVKLLNADYSREKFRELTQSEFTYCVGYLNREAEKTSNGQESYYPYAYDMESSDIVVEYDSAIECSDRLFMKVSGLHD